MEGPWAQRGEENAKLGRRRSSADESPARGGDAGGGDGPSDGTR
uniref:Uncharacterized protein n=1 Tax=Arundo donax TaxID=35708 RepID=A0A0A9GYY0_ARUDO